MPIIIFKTRFQLSFPKWMDKFLFPCLSLLLQIFLIVFFLMFNNILLIINNFIFALVNFLFHPFLFTLDFDFYSFSSSFGFYKRFLYFLNSLVISNILESFPLKSIYNFLLFSTSSLSSSSSSSSSSYFSYFSSFTSFTLILSLTNNSSFSKYSFNNLSYFFY